MLRTCRGVLGDHHAAEDATQAVFLALARQAASVGRTGCTAGWLFRVARRVATRAAPAAAPTNRSKCGPRRPPRIRSGRSAGSRPRTRAARGAGPVTRAISRTDAVVLF
ncbi:sigma factor [Frigoriglobus tundricola]|uniref:sigma factor n=1 Tax=Frigoriglobus tundricola TaxID=2774151 RepID=UPI0036F3824A